MGYSRLLCDLLSLPTAPLREEHVSHYIRTWAVRRPAIQLREDQFGNLHLILKRGRVSGKSPLVFSAHMDHPGFEAEQMETPRTLRAVWRGVVQKQYFRRAGARFFVDGHWIRGTIRSFKLHDPPLQKRVKSVQVSVEKPVPPGAIGMWDFPDPSIRDHRLYARGCDDVGGVAAILGAMDKLCQQNDAVHCVGLCTRAEEIGWAGAIAVAKHQLLPRAARIISIECSSQLPGVAMGGGPILRVGDRTSVFTPELTAWCQVVAEDLAKQNRQFRFQRKLMDAGACEASVFCALGYAATGLCIALGNYHNMDARRTRIAPEYIDLNDFEAMIRWFVALATTRHTADEAEIVQAIRRRGRDLMSSLRQTKQQLRHRSLS